MCAEMNGREGITVPVQRRQPFCMDVCVHSAAYICRLRVGVTKAAH